MTFFDVRLRDFIDILIVAFVIYRVLVLFAGTRAMQLLRGVLIIGFAGVMANFFELRSLSWIIEHVLSAFIIVIPILFQPELRRMLEELGKGHIISFSKEQATIDKRASELTNALVYCSEQRIGALCIFERGTSLKDVYRNGVAVGGDITEELLITIFWPGTPLHDGAVIIDKSSIVAASCYLPLTDKADISRWYGTRHRAALGVTEATDAVALVVSEERGEITAAAGGHFSHPLNREQLIKICTHYFESEEKDEGIINLIMKEIKTTGDK